MLTHVQQSVQDPVGNMQALVSVVIYLHVYRTVHVAMLALHRLAFGKLQDVLRLLLVCMHGPVHMHMHFLNVLCKSYKLCAPPYASALMSCLLSAAGHLQKHQVLMHPL